MAAKKISVLIALAAICTATQLAWGQSFGTFLDELHVRLISGGKVELLADFRFRDPENAVWLAPKGFVSDGASIPKIFWSIVGGPLDGDYRNAAVIHDRYCETKARDWRSTHKAFFFGMKAKGVSDTIARTMYYAVVAYGPRWKLQGKSICSTGPGGAQTCSQVNEVIADQPEIGKAELDDVQEFRGRVVREPFSNPAMPLQNLDYVEWLAITKGNTKFKEELRQ